MCGVTLVSKRNKNILLMSDIRILLTSMNRARLQDAGIRTAEYHADLSLLCHANKVKGRPLVGRLANDLKTHGLCDMWGALALDRVSWRAEVKAIRTVGCRPDRASIAIAAQRFWTS